MIASAPQPFLVLYSAVSTLAYWIAQRYYAQRHHVWCAPAPALDRFAPVNPPSSDPIRIYWTFHDDIAAGDEHSSKIKENRLGIIRGAASRNARGLIDEATRQSIEDTIRLAPLNAFAPLLLVIPAVAASGMVRQVDPHNRARVTAEEFIIDDLPRTSFDVLTLHR
jgi:hypothetical protein